MKRKQKKKAQKEIKTSWCGMPESLTDFIKIFGLERISRIPNTPGC